MIPDISFISYYFASSCFVKKYIELIEHDTGFQGIIVDVQNIGQDSSVFCR